MKAFLGKYLSRSFYWVGYSVGKHPGWYLIGIVVFTIFQSLGWLSFYHLQDLDYLYFVKHGRVETDRDTIEKLFPLNRTQSIDIGRVTRVLNAAVVILRAKDEGSVLREELVEEILDLNHFITNLDVECDGQKWNFTTLCSPWWFGGCIHNSALEILERMKEFKSKKFRPTYPVDWTSYETGFSMTFMNLGGVEVDENSRIVSAKAMRFLFQLDSGNDSLKHVLHAWEKKFLTELERKSFRMIDLAFFSSESVAHELKETTIQVLPLCIAACLVIICFAVLSCLSTNWIISKPWLGLAGSAATAFGVLSAFGFVLMCGVPYIDVVLSIPFLMLGIGIDDTFVLISAWRRTNRKDSVEKRMANSYSEAAVSITITSLTNFLSFCVGLATPFRITQIYSIYSMASVFFCYFYVIIFFGACMAFSGYREEKNIHPLTLQAVISWSEAGNKNQLYKILFCNKDTANNENVFAVWPMVFFRDHFSKLLLKKYSRHVVLLVFLCYLAFAGWGFSRLKEGIDYRNVFRVNSFGWKYMDWNYQYFTDYPQRIQVVINKPLDYSDPQVQKNIENLMERFENASFSAGPLMTESWLRMYKKVFNDRMSWLTFGGYNISNREDFYDGLKNIFFKFEIFKKFSVDVIFDNNATSNTITASRFLFQTKNIRNSVDEKVLLQELYQIVDSSEYPLIAFGITFPIIENLLFIRSISIQSVASAAAIMMLVFFLFVPNIKCAILIAFCIVSIEFGIIGYMTFWDVNLDALALLCLVMCVGFSVDFTSHISYAYLACKESSSEQRIRYSLYAAGMPVIQGAISTVLGVFFLIFADCYSFVIFFKIVFLVMVLAVLHAIFVLPILFSVSDYIFTRPVIKQTAENAEVEKLNSVQEDVNGLKNVDT